MDSHLKYRPEIDGLRAIAVLAVIIYHANFSFLVNPLMKGGFIGVDVFFVISGYLIASNLLSALNQGTYTLKSFYERRIRRILPALFFVMVAVIPFAWVYLYPKAMKEFSASGLSALFFGSNFYFWSEDTYTAENSLWKPLLHTWSLSVEEQFYLLFPLALKIVWRDARKHLVWVTTVILILSLCLAEWGSRNYLSITFYSLFTRTWELCAGIVLAMMSRNPDPKGFFPKLMPALGLFAILYSFLFFNDATIQPNFKTAIPVVGTMLFIWFARPDELATRILSSRPLVSVGLISYSLYLWHYPVFVFDRIRSIYPVSDLEKLLLIAICFLLSTFTYLFIEKPFRDRLRVPVKKLLMILSAVFVALLSFHGVAYLKNGIPERLNAFAQKAYQEYATVEWVKLSCYNRPASKACKFGDESWVALGDSYVGVLEPALKEHLEKIGHGFISLHYGQCPFVNDLWFGVPECPQINQERWALIRSFRTPKIFLITAADYQFKFTKKGPMSKSEPQDASVAWNSYIQNIRELLSLGHKVVLVYPVPTPDTDAKILFLRHAANGVVKPIYVQDEGEYDKTIEIGKRLDAIPDSANLIRIRPAELFCPLTHDQKRRCMIINEHGALYNNGAHLSHIGANLVMDEVIKQSLNWTRR